MRKYLTNREEGTSFLGMFVITVLVVAAALGYAYTQNAFGATTGPSLTGRYCHKGTSNLNRVAVTCELIQQKELRVAVVSDVQYTVRLSLTCPGSGNSPFVVKDAKLEHGFWGAQPAVRGDDCYLVVVANHVKGALPGAATITVVFGRIIGITPRAVVRN